MRNTVPRRREFQSLNASSLYRLNSKRYLERVIGAPWGTLEELAARTDNYIVFDILERGRDKARRIEWPKPALDGIQRRLLNLMCRIQSPDYLHSSLRGRSYLTNAMAHRGSHPAFTLDIKNYYPSTTHLQIYNCFHGVFQQASDVAGLLTGLCSFDGHLPTGSAVSQRLGYFVYKYLFDRIAAWCRSEGLIFTLYVDDLTISGPRATRSALRSIGRMITEAGLSFHKVQMYDSNDAKRITGVIVHGDRAYVQNKHQRKIYDQLIDLRSTGNDSEQLREIGARLLGRLNTAGQIEPRFQGWASNVKNDVRAALEALAANSADVA